MFVLVLCLHDRGQAIKVEDYWRWRNHSFEAACLVLNKEEKNERIYYFLKLFHVKNVKMTFYLHNFQGDKTIIYTVHGDKKP